MTVTNSHAPGTFSWIELGTSNTTGAKAFYTDLFGWTVNEIPMGEMGIYYIFQKSGRDAAAMYQQGPDQEGIPPHWLSYVAVSSADAAAEKAASLGANVAKGPFDVFDQGRMAVIGDPQGAMFAIWEAKASQGLGVRDEDDTLCWNELQARDATKAKAFYSALFGWRLKDSPEYSEIYAGDKAIGGMMNSQSPPEVPSHGMPYFAVADCDATVKKAQAGGAMVYVPPMDIPKVGRFAVLADPQGAVFAVIKLDRA